MQLYIYTHIRTSLQVSSTNLLICYWYIYHRCIPFFHTKHSPSSAPVRSCAMHRHRTGRRTWGTSQLGAWKLGRWECSAMSAGSWEEIWMHSDHFGGRTKNVRIIKDYQSNQIRKNSMQNAKWNHTSHHRNWKQREFVSLMKRLEKNQRS